MKKLFWFLLVLLCSRQAFSQHVYQIRADSVRIYNVCDTAELIIENRTRGVSGFLYNKGNGVTEFRRIQLESVGNGQIAIIGQDTLDLSTLPGIGGIDTIYRSGNNIIYVKKGVQHTINLPAPANTWQDVMTNGNTSSLTPVVNPSSGEGLKILHDDGFISGYTGNGFIRNGFLRFGNSSLNLYTERNIPLYFGSGNLTRLAIMENGNIGIGTTSPSTMLDVNGAINSSSSIQASFFKASTPLYSSGGYNLLVHNLTTNTYERTATIPASMISGSVGTSSSWQDVMSNGSSSNIKATIIMNPSLDASLYSGGHYEARSNTYPSYGFHVPGVAGVALYLKPDASQANLRLRTSSNLDYSLWHSGNDGAGSGLDADLLDGYDVSLVYAGNTVPVRDASGHLYANHFNTVAPLENITPTKIFGSNDNFIRALSPSSVRTFIGLPETGGSGDNLQTVTNVGSNTTNSITAQSYYIQNSSTLLGKGADNSLRITTPSGYVEFGPQNSGWAHFLTDRPAFYFEKDIYLNGTFRRYNSTGYFDGNNMGFQSGDGNGIRFWDGSPTYSISMASATGASGGRVNDMGSNDYNMYLRMHGANFGFVFVPGSGNPVVQIDNYGISNNAWFRSVGDGGWFNQTHGGGFYMVDNDWIRTYGNKNIYQNTGILRTDGELQVGSDGATLKVPSGGVPTINGNAIYHTGNLQFYTKGIDVPLKTTTDGYLGIENWIRITDNTGLFTNSGKYFYNRTDLPTSWSFRSASSQEVGLDLQTSEGTSRGGFYANSTGETGIKNPGATAWRLKTDVSGNTYITGQVQATSFYQSSLRSLKKNITAYTTSGLDVLAKAQVRTFQFKADKTGHTNIGFIADEVPDEMSIPGRTGVDQASTVALLVKSVQELNEQNKVLKDEVKELKALVQQLVNKASQ